MPTSIFDPAAIRDPLPWLVQRASSSPALVVDQRGSGKVVEFRRNGSAVWEINPSGHLVASLDNAYDIGSVDDNRLRNIYQVGAHFFRPSDITSNRDILSVRVGSEANPRHKVLLNTAGQLVFQSGPGGATAPTDALTLPANTTSAVAINRNAMLSGHLLWSIDGGGDIGQSGTNRPRHIYTWGDVWVGNWLRTGYGAFLGGTTPSWWKFDPQATRFLIRDDTSSLDKLALTRAGLAADGDTALSIERRAAGASALVAVRWKDASALVAGDKVLILAS